MAVSMLYGRNAKAAGAPQTPGRSASGSAQTIVNLPLAQSPRSVAPQPRFRPPEVSPVPRPYTAPGMSGAGPWRGGDGAQDGLIFRDRAAWLNRGTEVAGRHSSMPDPPSDGPIRPSLRLVNQTWNYQAGTGAAYADDLTRPYTRVGEKGTPWVPVYGGTPGFYRQGPGGPPVGDPGQGPVYVTSGPPHGLHTQYPPDRQQSLAGFRARPQMVAPRVDRLSNSRIAGQNYSQWTRHQGGASR